LELAKELGATHTINMKDPKNSSLKDAVRSLFPDGVSIAIDTTGVPAVIEQSLECIIKLGKFVIIGVPAAPEYELSFHVVTHINVKCSARGLIKSLPT
jgi:aryl-alcohol dehydrogenase